MKEEYDHRMKTKEHQIAPGSQVLLKSPLVGKAHPKWDPDPFTVSSVKGSMVTAERGCHRTTRNVSFFKQFVGSEDHFDSHLTDGQNEVTVAPSQPISDLSPDVPVDYAQPPGNPAPKVPPAKRGRPSKADVQKRAEAAGTRPPTSVNASTHPMNLRAGSRLNLNQRGGKM